MDDIIEEGLVVFGQDESTVPALKSYLFEKTTEVFRSVQFSYAQKATQEFQKIFDGRHIFDNPKSFSDLKQLVEYLTSDEDVVLDFFSGSCSLAHAVLEANHNGPNRSFICVQLPEPVNTKTKTGEAAFSMGLKTIAEIGKERIRRVIAKMKKERSGELPLKERGMPEDLGFKVFKLAESHYKPWSGVDEKNPTAYAKTMSLFTDPLVPGWMPEDVIWEVAVKEGFGLTSRIEEVKEAKGLDVHRVTDPDKDQSFLICLENKINLSSLKPLDLKKDTLFICRDAALDDETAANLALQCRLRTI